MAVVQHLSIWILGAVNVALVVYAFRSVKD
jgi:hypothetical protein